MPIESDAALVAIEVFTLAPLVGGVILRLMGARGAARVAATLAIIFCLLTGVIIEASGRDGVPYVIFQAALSVLLWIGARPADAPRRQRIPRPKTTPAASAPRGASTA